MSPYEKLIKYKYIMVFAGALLDHSGIPVSTVATAVLSTREYFDTIPSLILILLGTELGDLLAVLLGRTASTRSIRYMNPALQQTATFIRSNPVTTYILSKWIPGIGKYAPVASGFAREHICLILLKYLPGNILYSVAFFAAGRAIGPFILEHTFTVGMVIGIPAIGFTGWNVYKFIVNNKSKTREKIS